MESCLNKSWEKLTDNIWTLRRQGVQGGRRKGSTKTHLFQISIFPTLIVSLLANLIQDVSKAVHIQGGEIGDAFQAESLRAVTGLDTKEEACWTADNCTAIPAGQSLGESDLGF